MDVIGAMKARRSVRSYLPRKVEQEKLNAVLEAVRLTPSRHNDQNIRVIVVRDSALKQQIRQQEDNQQRETPGTPAQQRYQQPCRPLYARQPRPDLP